jgi:hypothetical protein
LERWSLKEEEEEEEEEAFWVLSCI